jgi:hypothetical protein
MKNKTIWYLIGGAVVLYIGLIQYKKYLIDQAFKKGLLEDTPVNRQAFANQSLKEVIQTVKTLKK